MRARIILTVVAAAFAAIALATGALAGASKKPPKPAKAQARAAKLESRALFSVPDRAQRGRRQRPQRSGRPRRSRIVHGDRRRRPALLRRHGHQSRRPPVAAHIHAGRRNQSNPPLVPLTQPATGDSGAASGCVAVDQADAQAILKNPHKHYFNVHTAAFPNGAVRGQLSRKSH
jgi:CHRD domain